MWFSYCYPELTSTSFGTDVEFDYNDQSITKKVPKHLTVSALKGIAGILFSIKPFKTTLHIALNEIDDKVM